jgi:hypothetical protein
MFTAALPGNRFSIYIYIYIRAFVRHGLHRKHSFLSIVFSIRVYGAVVWQRVDQIRYNIYDVTDDDDDDDFSYRVCLTSSF